MATKLKNLNVTKVDFVDAGANPDAHIKLFKNRDGVPAPPKESIWKKLCGFFARESGIQPEELTSVLESVQKSGATTFAEQLNERKTRKIADEMWDICFALENSLCSIMLDDELDSTMASSAMQESLNDFVVVVTSAINQWANGKTASIAKSEKPYTEADIEIMKDAQERITKAIEMASNPLMGSANNPNEKKGENETMNIDKSKLTEAERAFLESIEKRYGVAGAEGNAQPLENTGMFSQPTTPPQTSPTFSAAAPTFPAAASSAPSPASTFSAGNTSDAVAKALATLGLAPAPTDEDIYKGLNPVVKAKIEAMEKFWAAAEDRELHEVAKGYAIIGKKEDELVPVLKSLKAAGGTAYNDMIAILDQTKSAIEKSGIFSEIGKVGNGFNIEGDTIAKARTKIDEIRKANPELTEAQALDKVLMADPELRAEYDN